MITQKQIIDALEYDPATGVFIRRRTGKNAGKLKVKGNGYSRIKIWLLGRDHMAHRLAWVYMTGDQPPAAIDHIDRDATNNAWANIRNASGLNQKNKSKQRNNKSGITGVSWSKTSGKWCVRIWSGFNGEKKYQNLGLFSDIGEAGRVACEFRAKNGYSDGHGKFQPKYMRS